jgi:hypothetical protein
MYGRVLSFPITFLIDRNGKIRFKHQGVTDFNIIDVKSRRSYQDIEGTSLHCFCAANAGMLTMDVSLTSGAADNNAIESARSEPWKASCAA